MNANIKSVQSATATQYQFEAIDLNQAQRQLELLGYSPSETVYLREFAGKPAKFYPGVTPRNAVATIATLPKNQSRDRGLYFVVNGQGQKKADIKTGRALFCEWDDRPMEDQLLAWEVGGFVEPTVQVTTRKSCHTYWSLETPIPIADWVELQQDLNEFLDADRTIKDPSRVMRLAGGWHVGKDTEGNDLEPISCDIVHEKEVKYTYEELRGLIPQRKTDNPLFNQPHEPTLQASKKDSNSTQKTNKNNQKLVEIHRLVSPDRLYDWVGHNFIFDGSTKGRGCCPWHDSQSGTAFHIEPNGASGEWLFHCPSCDIGGNLINYKHLMNQSNGKPREIDPKSLRLTPTQKEIDNILSELVQQMENEGLNIPNTLSELLDRAGYVERLTIGQKVIRELYSEKEWISIDGILHSFTGSYYQQSPEVNERKKIAVYCNDFYIIKDNEKIFPYAKKSAINEAYDYVVTNLAIDPNLINPPGINFKNGVLQITWDGKKPTWELKPHSPERYYVCEPLIAYDPQADSTDCDRLLGCLAPSHQDIFLKVIASAFDLEGVKKYLGRSIRAILAKGSGNNGKDTLREAISVVFGHQGLTGVSIANFEEYDKGRYFSLVPIEKSRINWSSENATTSRLDKVQSLKQVITGDPITIERKHQDGYQIKPKCVMFFNINDNPYLMATQEAIRSRFAILPFGKTFVKNANPFYGEIEADPRFKEDPEFIKSQIAPAMVNKLLDALSRLMSEGIDYSPLDEAMKDVQREDNHLWDFAEETGLSYSENPSDFLPIEDIYLKLRKWYMNEGILSSGYSGDQWIDPDRPGDKWIKASRSVGGKILELFPKAKKAKIRTGENRATKSGLIGVSFSLNEEGGCQMDGKRMAKRMANGIAETPSMTQVDGKDPKFSKRLDSESIKEIKERDFQEKEGEGENNEKLEKNLFLNLGHLASTDAAARVSAVPFDIHLASNLTSTPALAHTVKNILCNATKPKKLDDLLLLVQTRLKWEVLTAQELEHALDNLLKSGEIEKVNDGYQLGKF